MEYLIKSNIKIIKDTIKEKSLGVLESKINEYSMNLLSYLITQNQDINYYQDVNHFLVMAILNKIFYYLSIGDFIGIFVSEKFTLQKNAENIFITCYHQAKNLLYKNETFSLTHYDKFVEINKNINKIDLKLFITKNYSY